MLDGCVLCGQTKRIPTHGLQDGLSGETLKSSDDVAQGVGPDMTHVQLTARIRKHG